MVDIDDLKDDVQSGKSSSSSSSSSSSGSSSSGSSSDVGESDGTFSLDDDETLEPDDKTVSRTSKKWAEEHGDLNYESQGNESLQQYMTRQAQEVEELHENVREMARNNQENFDEFTLYMHTLFLNFAHNRVGIMETIKEQFGKSDREAFKLTNKICERAGEQEFMEGMVRDITKNLADL